MADFSTAAERHRNVKSKDTRDIEFIIHKTKIGERFSINVPKRFADFHWHTTNTYKAFTIFIKISEHEINVYISEMHKIGMFRVNSLAVERF